MYGLLGVNNTGTLYVDVDMTPDSNNLNEYYEGLFVLSLGDVNKCDAVSMAQTGVRKLDNDRDFREKNSNPGYLESIGRSEIMIPKSYNTDKVSEVGGRVSLGSSVIPIYSFRKLGYNPFSEFRGYVFQAINIKDSSRLRINSLS